MIGSGSVIRDHSDHGGSNKPMNPCPECIHRFILSTMIRVISDHWSWSGSQSPLSLLNIVFFLSLPFRLFQNSVDSPNTLFTLLTSAYLWKLRTSRFFIVYIVLLFLLQFDLVCRVSALSVLNKAIMFLGYMIGVLLGGFLSDKFGRRPVVYYLSVLCNILALAASFVQVYWLYICLRCVVGLTIGKLSDSDWW